MNSERSGRLIPYLPHITEDGRTRRVYCIMIIDDHSRLLVGGELFYNDNACNFQKVLKDAIATYGIPDKLYVDYTDVLTIPTF